MISKENCLLDYDEENGNLTVVSLGLPLGPPPIQTLLPQAQKCSAFLWCRCTLYMDMYIYMYTYNHNTHTHTYTQMQRQIQIHTVRHSTTALPFLCVHKYFLKDNCICFRFFLILYQYSCIE